MSLKTLSLFYRHIILELHGGNGKFLRYYKVEIGTYLRSFYLVVLRLSSNKNELVVTIYLEKHEDQGRWVGNGDIIVKLG